MYKIAASPLGTLSARHPTSDFETDKLNSHQQGESHSSNRPALGEVVWTVSLGGLAALGTLLIVLSLSPVVMMALLLLLLPIAAPVLMLLMTLSYDGAETWVEENYAHDSGEIAGQPV